MRQIFGYLVQMLPSALVAAVLFLALRRPRRQRLLARGLSSPDGREGALLLFVMFLAGLATLTLLPRIAWEDGRAVFLTAPGTGGLNLMPGKSLGMLRAFWRAGNLTAFAVNLWGNILMFLPVGFFVALLWDRPRWWKSTLTVCGMSLFVELCQMFVVRGTDVDDWILNTAGGLLGYWCFLLSRHFWPKLTEKFKLKKVRNPHYGSKTRD